MSGRAKARIAPLRLWRGACLAFVCVFVAGLSIADARAQAPGVFPDRPITLICPWTLGGNTDIALRALAEAASKQLGKRIVIENKPGAGGALGAQGMAANAKPDGYTLSQIPLGVFRLPHMVKTTFDPLTDLTWILNVAGYQFGVSVRADSPWKNVGRVSRVLEGCPRAVSRVPACGM